MPSVTCKFEEISNFSSGVPVNTFPMILWETLNTRPVSVERLSLSLRIKVPQEGITSRDHSVETSHEDLRRVYECTEEYVQY